MTSAVPGSTEPAFATPLAIGELRLRNRFVTRRWSATTEPRTGVVPHILDRGKPRVIGVLANGQRFVNEALGYRDYTLAMVEKAPAGSEVCSWLVADARYLRHYPLGMAKPSPAPKWPYLRSGYLTRADTLRELASRIGVEPGALDRTVAEFNVGARRGDDPRFGRGRTPFERGSGDPDNPYPNPSLAPIEDAPFYAVKVVPGSFGTFAGLVTDTHSRVLDAAGAPSEVSGQSAPTRPASWVASTRPAASTLVLR
jgi:succinate dehydrogenase/fumarate reductase flavoprotein subunit